MINSTNGNRIDRFISLSDVSFSLLFSTIKFLFFGFVLVESIRPFASCFFTHLRTTFVFEYWLCKNTFTNQPTTSNTCSSARKQFHDSISVESVIRLDFYASETQNTKTDEKVGRRCVFRRSPVSSFFPKDLRLLPVKSDHLFNLPIIHFIPRQN